MGTPTPLSDMPDNYLSLKEAETYTKKSRSTLRRFVITITKPEKHADRHLIQPSTEEVARLHAENHPFSWLVSQDLLDREFPKSENSGSETTEDFNQDSSKVITLLTQTVAMLENELVQKNKQIESSQERQRENILLKKTTEQLVLLNSGAEDEISIVEVQQKVVKEDTPKGDRETLWDKLNKPIFGKR